VKLLALVALPHLENDLTESEEPIAMFDKNDIEPPTHKIPLDFPMLRALPSFVN
jgi:hypothetical protein